MPGILWKMVSSSRGGLVISSAESLRGCGLRPKSESGCRVGFCRRLLADNGEGVVPSSVSSSSSSSANTNVSPRALRKNNWFQSGTVFTVHLSETQLNRPAKRQVEGFFLLTHHATRDLEVGAAAFVILAHGVTLARPQRVKAILTAAHTGLCTRYDWFKNMDRQTKFISSLG